MIKTQNRLNKSLKKTFPTLVGDFFYTKFALQKVKACTDLTLVAN